MQLMQMILNSKKVKYSVLENLVKELPHNTDELNIFINADSIFKPFYSPQVKEQMNALNISDKYLLSSEFINIIAHYRHFFYSRYQMPTNFFIYYSNKKSKYPKSILNEYKDDFYDKRDIKSYEFGVINTMIERNMELSSLLSEYLPNIYIINTETLSPSVLPYTIIKRNGNIDNLTNLILTNDKIEFQLANIPNTYILDLKSDESRIISKNNLMETLLNKSKTKKETLLNPNYYVSILSISGFKSYNIEGIPGCGNIKAINKIEKLISNSILNNDDISSDFSITAGNIFSESEYINIIKNNYKCLSIENLYNNMTPKEDHNIRKYLKNKSDNMSLMEINNLYYSDYPLMLLELMEGEC